MGWFASEEEHYTVDVLEPDSDERGVVTCKRLTAGEHAQVQDAMYDAEQGEGSARFILVKNAVVSWTLPIPYTESTLASLSPVVFQQIYVGIKKEDVNPFAQAALAAARLRAEAADSPTTESPVPVEPVAAGGE